MEKKPILIFHENVHFKNHLQDIDKWRVTDHNLILALLTQVSRRHNLEA